MHVPASGTKHSAQFWCVLFQAQNLHLPPESEKPAVVLAFVGLSYLFKIQNSVFQRWHNDALHDEIRHEIRASTTQASSFGINVNNTDSRSNRR